MSYPYDAVIGFLSFLMKLLIEYRLGDVFLQLCEIAMTSARFCFVE